MNLFHTFPVLKLSFANEVFFDGENFCLTKECYLNKKPCDFGLKTERCTARRGLLPDCDIFDKTGFLKFKDLHIIDDRFSLARKWSRGKVTTEKPCHFIQKCGFWLFDQQVVLRPVSEKLEFQKRSFLSDTMGEGIKPVLLWFRTALRTHDNPCLSQALSEQVSSHIVQK